MDHAPTLLLSVKHYDMFDLFKSLAPHVHVCVCVCVCVYVCVCVCVLACMRT